MQRFILKSKMFQRPETLHEERVRIINQLQEGPIGVAIVGPEYDVILMPNEWVRTDVIKPQPLEDIIMCTKEGYRYIGLMDELERFIAIGIGTIENVVAWMPAPIAYEVENGRCL